jgi:hypothetical protein
VSKSTTYYAVALVTCIFFGFSTSANAANFPNGSFESGDFTGWQTLGDTAVQSTTFGDTQAKTPEGTYSALLSNGAQIASIDKGAVNVENLESFLGLQVGALSSLNVYNGSAISQTFNLTTSSVLSFSWNFFTNEFVNQAVNTNDFAFGSDTFSRCECGSLSKHFLIELFQFDHRRSGFFHDPRTWNIPTWIWGS